MYPRDAWTNAIEVAVNVPWQGGRNPAGVAGSEGVAARYAAAVSTIMSRLVGKLQSQQIGKVIIISWEACADEDRSYATTNLAIYGTTKMLSADSQNNNSPNECFLSQGFMIKQNHDSKMSAIDITPHLVGKVEGILP